MVASLIGFMLRGPVQIVPADRHRAKAHFEQVRVMYDTVQAATDDAEHEQAVDSLGELLSTDKSLVQFEEDEELLAAVKCGLAPKLLEQFIEFWEMGSEQVYFRDFDGPDGRFRVLFTGAPTWGDDPDTEEYVTLKLGLTLGLDRIFGIS